MHNLYFNVEIVVKSTWKVEFEVIRFLLKILEHVRDVDGFHGLLVKIYKLFNGGNGTSLPLIFPAVSILHYREGSFFGFL